MSVLLRHEGCDECGSSDAKAVYKDDDDSLSSHCFSCGATVASASYKEQNKPKIKQVKKEEFMSEVH